ncbi:hypothetical protein TM1040_1600 [Ruegeria sp. TM1040]|nr:hypothetical protein TM1040_1600 [Ruegeria sp. TM1040]
MTAQSKYLGSSRPIFVSLAHPFTTPIGFICPTKHCIHWTASPPVGSADLTPSAAKYGVVICVKVSLDLSDTATLTPNVKNNRHGLRSPRERTYVEHKSRKINASK